MEKQKVILIVATAVALAVLAVIGLDGCGKQQDIMLEVTSHLKEQNEKISDLKTQSSRLETALQTLKEETAASVNQHRDQIEQLGHQLSQLNTALLSLKKETAASTQQQNAQIEQQGNQLSQLETTLKGDIAAPVSEPDEKT